MTARMILDGCALATMDDSGNEYERGYIAIEGHRIARVQSDGLW